jgi:hypothetical protein
LNLEFIHLPNYLQKGGREEGGSLEKEKEQLKLQTYPVPNNFLNREGRR